MMDVGRHPKIKLLTYSEIEDISGYIGNFHIKVRKKSRYVKESECTACEECSKVCPVVIPDEHQLGLASRKAIYIPFPQAVPSAYLIDMEHCLGTNPIACGKCIEVCDKKCIDYDMKDEIVEFDVGTVIVATGVDVYDPTVFDEYGYTRFENVITSMEFEILTGPGGVTFGELLRLTDKRVPKTIGFIQCVGSRDSARGKSYCSNVCCMNTVKDTLFLKEHYPDIEAKVFYMDIRAFGKGFEELYRRSKEARVQYIRGIPGDIREDPETRNLILTVEDTTAGKIEEHELEMVVLSVGVTPRNDSDHIQKLLTLSRTGDGFFMESHPKLKPVDAPTGGVFLAGCAEAPKDIKDSVTQASGAAARAENILSAGRIKIEAITCRVNEDLCNLCSVCARVCPYKAMKVDAKNRIPASVIEAACQGCGTCGAECRVGAITMRHFTDEQIMAQIEAILEKDPQEKIVAFACNWCSYGGADIAGLSRLQYPTSPRVIRTMCSGRVDERFVLHAFELGAPIVLVSGCHFADCHYINAVQWTQRRVEKLWDKLEKMGIRPERLQLEYISAAEGAKWSRTMKELDEMRKKVSKAEIEKTKKVLSEAHAS
ncbi:methyl-viologen-reducing hydrogenase subunit delta [candidate division TA06 bacterium DG_26]|uniref:Methyl-viologen-reducing hydrogenase subunit delta n=1 Tax=candidate division TA06 bacterium DG_26 TaxID=1703771 RepID=A0A0S7WE68_UNCT6|nr:MAG: methyl-viologen-reducing hydrogenase subunit delta [candidate division TA06 bacterium DG_26]